MNSIIVFLVSISFIFSNYNQFNQAFIDVSKEQSPTIVSIISEKIEKVNNNNIFYTIRGCPKRCLRTAFSHLGGFLEKYTESMKKFQNTDSRI